MSTTSAPAYAASPVAEGGMRRALGRLRYAAAQGTRVAWYFSQYSLARRLSGPFTPPDEPAYTPKAPAADRRQVWLSFLDLFAQDRSNIEEGLYPAPRDLAPARLPGALVQSVRFFQDLPHVDARRMARRGVEVREANEALGRFPAYYLQNFHYQTGGWLTEESARLYDTQVEILFGGAADAMRRIALGSLARSLRGQDQRRLRHLDVACGNGRFLSQVLEGFPKLPVTGLDLSPAYVAEARRRLSPWAQAELVVGLAENQPFPDAAFDTVSCIYLFHELPPKVRRAVAREMARVLKPGGVIIFADSLQTGDSAELDRMLEIFPLGFHEPFYNSYLGEDFSKLFGEAGLHIEELRLAFLTKVMRLRKA